MHFINDETNGDAFDFVFSLAMISKPKPAISAQTWIPLAASLIRTIMVDSARHTTFRANGTLTEVIDEEAYASKW